MFRDLIVTVDQAVGQLTRELRAKAPNVLPKGMGRLTCEAVETEAAGWDRLKNRRQVGSHAGLTGGVSASGQSSADLSITRAVLRFSRFQQASLKSEARKPKSEGRARARKRAIIALARQLLVDL